MHNQIDSDLAQLEDVEREIRTKLMGAHLNVRVVFATLDPTIEGARRVARCASPECHTAAQHVIAALREFAYVL